ncbi:MAG TPA: hypothetical protein VFR67_25975 [Pilimelia sp.]|nr:hypothetical protein [Pilimelia sp.]
MRLFGRRPKVPVDRRPPLEREERLLAWARASPDGVVVVTNRGVWLPGRSGRLGWHQIHKAVWSGRELAVTPGAVVAEREGYAVVADEPVVSYLLLDPGDVPHQIRARVTRSVAYTAHHPAPGGGVRVAARRVSGVDGLTWTVRFDPGTDGESDSARAAVSKLVEQARGTAGGPD